MKKRLALVMGSALFGLSACASMSHGTANETADDQQPAVVSEIDVNQYLGTWYEIGRLPMPFQDQCVGDVTATYGMNEDGTLSVRNQCRIASGEMDSATGVAYPQNDGNSKLKVSFLPDGLRWIPFTKGDYWIMRIDADYQTVLVGDPDRKYLWLLSRTPTVDDTTYQSYLNTAKTQGYDLSEWQKTTQTGQ